jgi:thymidylate synthase (FAD)
MQVRILSASCPWVNEIMSAVDNAEYAARTCHKSQSKLDTNPNFLATIIRQGHWSVLEHNSVTFEITGVSRALTHQLVRHRLCSFSQESQRHVDPSVDGNLPVVVPNSIAFNPEANKIYSDLMDAISESYKALAKLNIPKEDVRFVLPNACTTSIVVTANWRTWLELLQKRLDRAAQWEIKQLAQAIYTQLNVAYPEVFNETTLQQFTSYHIEFPQ